MVIRLSWTVFGDSDNLHDIEWKWFLIWMGFHVDAVQSALYDPVIFDLENPNRSKNFILRSLYIIHSLNIEKWCTESMS